MALDFQSTLDQFPDAPSPDVSDKYAFIDTKRVIADMADLGFQVHSTRFPAYRTRAGRFGLHEVDFRRPADIGKPGKLNAEVPRVLFLNSYDGSRRAQIITGIFRLVCLNGMIAGNAMDNEKFLHLGNYEEEFAAQIKGIGSRLANTLDTVERFKSVKIDRKTGIEMAKAALEIKDLNRGDKYRIDPKVAIMPRRQEDTHEDLWTQWNVLQENLLKGGIPSTSSDGRVRMTRPVTQIAKSNRINAELWGLLEDTAEKVA